MTWHAATADHECALVRGQSATRMRHFIDGDSDREDQDVILTLFDLAP